MDISAEERLMYGVMKAVYDSGIPVSFKGSMVLKACLIDAGYSEETRHTVDIDANWNTTEPPTADQMITSFQEALSNSGIDLKVTLYRMFGPGRSAGFELTHVESGEVLFTMDVDVNRPLPPTKIYDVEGICFRGVAPVQMLADKVAAISTDKVFRRIKDIVDLYYLSRVVGFDPDEVCKTLMDSQRKLGDFHGFLCMPDELKHAYDKFRFTGDVSKPPFDEVYQAVRSYIATLLPSE